MKYAGLFFLLLILLLVLLGPSRPAYITLDQPEQAFVYADAGAVVLVVAEGEYELGSTRLPAGCYRLDPPGPGAARGTASWMGEACP